MGLVLDSFPVVFHLRGQVQQKAVSGSRTLAASSTISAFPSRSLEIAGAGCSIVLGEPEKWSDLVLVRHIDRKKSHHRNASATIAACDHIKFPFTL